MSMSKSFYKRQYHYHAVVTECNFILSTINLEILDETDFELMDNSLKILGSHLKSFKDSLEVIDENNS